jgi:hypothetical protein
MGQLCSRGDGDDEPTVAKFAVGKNYKENKDVFVG